MGDGGAASGQRWGGKWATVGRQVGDGGVKKTVTSGFRGFPERILSDCERNPSGDWVLPGVRG